MATGAGSPVTTLSFPVRREPMAENEGRRLGEGSWQEILGDIAGQAHSSGVAVSAFAGTPKYHDHPDLERCSGPSCQWFRRLRDDLQHADHAAAARAERLERIVEFGLERLGAIATISGWHDDTREDAVDEAVDAIASIRRRLAA